MNADEHPLIQSWRRFDPQTPPYLHPGDPEIENKYAVEFHSQEEWIQSPLFGTSDTMLHLGLFPVPFVGNLATAKVFILLLNPGLGPSDYFAEYQVSGFRDAQLRAIHQENGDDEFPFMGLNPGWPWHGGFIYWEGKLRNIAHEMVDKWDITYVDALRHLSSHVAALELIPYHSPSFGAHALIKQLESTRLARDYVHEILEPKARRGDCLIIVTRQVKQWGLKPHQNIILYKGGETRGAFLTMNSRGGKAIARTLGL